MRFYATASGPKVRDAMTCGLLGQIVTPAAGNALGEDIDWIADNGCYGNGYPGNAAYLTWLRPLAARAGDRCSFVVAPDVVGDATATAERAAPMLGPIRDLGVPVAYVGQNSATPDALPWPSFDVLFVGGDTTWKLGAEARALVAEARRRGLGAHMGRVNSWARLRYARAIGCTSADGTYLAFGPDRNLPRLLRWLAEVNDQGLLWEVAG